MRKVAWRSRCLSPRRGGSRWTDVVAGVCGPGGGSGSTAVAD